MISPVIVDVKANTIRCQVEVLIRTDPCTATGCSWRTPTTYTPSDSRVTSARTARGISMARWTDLRRTRVTRPPAKITFVDRDGTRYTPAIVEPGPPSDRDWIFNGDDGQYRLQLTQETQAWERIGDAPERPTVTVRIEHSDEWCEVETEEKPG